MMKRRKEGKEGCRERRKMKEEEERGWIARKRNKTGKKVAKG